MAKWLVEVFSLPERSLLMERDFARPDAAEAFVYDTLKDWACECVLTDREGERRPRNFQREPMVGRYDDWD